MSEYFWTGEEFPIGADKVSQRDQLGRCKLPAANQANANAVFIITFAMSADLSQRTSVFNRSVQSDDMMVSAALPAAFLMPAVNIFNGKVFAIRGICAMNNDLSIFLSAMMTSFDCVSINFDTGQIPVKRGRSLFQVELNSVQNRINTEVEVIVVAVEAGQHKG